MSVEKFGKIFSGSMGHFWPLDDNGKPINKDSVSGYIQAGKIGLVELKLSMKTPWGLIEDSYENLPDVKVIYGTTVNGPVFLFQVNDSGGTEALGGAKASVRRYRAYSVAIAALDENVKSTSITEIDVFFPGIERWAGVRVSEEKPDYFKDGRLKGFSLKVEHAPEDIANISQQRQIALSARWSIDGPVSKRRIFAPVSIICRTSSPVDLWKLLEPILRIQELVSLAYDGFVVADGGALDLEFAERPPKRPSFWNYFLMHTPAGVKVPSRWMKCQCFGLSR